MKNSRYCNQFQHANQMHQRSITALNYLDGTNKKDYGLIDVACKTLTESQKIMDAYYSLSRAEQEQQEIIDNVVYFQKKADTKNIGRILSFMRFNILKLYNKTKAVSK